MSHADIQGLDAYSGRKNNLDLTAQEFLMLVEARFPGAGEFIVRERGGEKFTVPRSLEMPRERAARLDDGEMSLRELAVVAEVSVYTAWAARQEKSRV